MIKTFKGLLADGAQDTIRLGTNQGLIGYRIKKFNVIEKSPLDTTARWSVKIFKTLQTTITTLIDFSDSSILAVGIWTSNGSAQTYPEDMTVIFDSEIFNQDIYITAKAENGSAVNYYIELEQVKLDLSEATVATLKDMRGRE